MWPVEGVFDIDQSTQILKEHGQCSCGTSQRQPHYDKVSNIDGKGRVGMIGHERFTASHE